MTTRGFREAEAEIVAHLTADVLDAPTDVGTIAAVAEKAQSLCDAFPVYASSQS
jgi:glycine hydroxymethyltransferase